MNRIVSNSAISAASRIAPIRGAVGGWLRTVGIRFLESTYSQELESEADQLGVRLMAAAGYDPRACVRLFRRLAKLKSAPEDFDRFGSYFTSHPPFDVRIENINIQLHQLRRQAPHGRAQA